jgi:hypothetical protein
VGLAALQAGHIHLHLAFVAGSATPVPALGVVSLARVVFHSWQNPKATLCAVLIGLVIPDNPVNQLVTFIAGDTDFNNPLLS